MKLELDIPDGVMIAEKMNPPAFGRHLRLVGAMKLYEMGHLSSGCAADLADMSRVEFLSRTGDYQVFPFAAELDELEHGNATPSHS